MLDPRKSLIAIDSNVLDRNDTDRDRLLDRFFTLIESGSISVIITKSVRKEILNSDTPNCVKNKYLKLRSVGSEPSKEQSEKRKIVSAIISAKSLRYKHEVDARMVCEAAEQNCHYLITEDKRILSKDLKLRVIFPNLDVTNLRGFLNLYDKFLRM